MNSFIFGETATGNPIPAFRFGPQTARAHVLIMGGVHGDEIEGLWAANGLLKSFAGNFPFNLRVTLVPAFNVDGMLAKDRRNGNKVDLNRNLPTKDWSPEIATERYHPGLSAGSETENQALAKFIEKEKPHYILSLHSWKPMLNINGDCRKDAEVIAKATGYIIEETIGYPTPGCLGTYAGLERGIPTLTYEIERGLDQASILAVHVPAILKSLPVSESRG